MNIKEAVTQLSNAGIEVGDKDVITWIKQGKLKAEMIRRRNITYRINAEDLNELIKEERAAYLEAKLEESQRKNEILTDQIELLKARVHIEQAKVRTLKRLLNDQIEADGPSGFHSELLGLEHDSDNHVLKKEFKKLLKALHPDRGGDERLFKVFKGHYDSIK
ncbi:hypothetical protein A8F94_22645 [Bacillus sp. FJAT-27225]|nr:hypothetical protein A8F94_22645 [Bacillus sp. FJAT-27225]